jgi:hypothetical protein
MSMGIPDQLKKFYDNNTVSMIRRSGGYANLVGYFANGVFNFDAFENDLH